MIQKLKTRRFIAFPVLVVLFLVSSISAPLAKANDVLQSSIYQDANGDGMVDRIIMTMDENVVTCPYEAGDWAVITPGTINVTAITGLACTGADHFLQVNVTASAGITGGGVNPVISYTDQGATHVTLASGDMGNHGNITPTDNAAPKVATQKYEDSNSDGMVDRITLTLTESVTTQTAVLGDFAYVANDITGSVLAGGSISYPNATTVRLTLGTPGNFAITNHTIAPTLAYTDGGGTAIADGAANQLVSFGATNLSDGAGPYIMNVSSTTANGTYTGTDSINVRLTFSEAVTVTGTPQITLETGTTDEVIDYNGVGSGTANINFTYTVTASGANTSDTSADLDYVNTSSLALNGGTISDAASNVATLTLQNPGAGGSLGANAAIVINTSATATNVQPNTLENGKNVGVTATFTSPNAGASTIPANGKIIITFGNGFTVTNAANPNCATMDGGFAIASDNNAHTVTITRDGTGAAQAGNSVETCTFSGITNPIATGSTGTYKIQVANNAGTVKFKDLVVIADTISGGGNGGNNGGPVVWSPGGGVVAPSPAPAPAPSPATPPASPTPAPGTTPADGNTTPTDSNNGGTVTPGLPFTDVGGHWAVEFIKKLYDLKVVNGRTPTTFAPDAYLTRAELVKISMLLFGYEVKDGESCKDVKAGVWYHSVMATAKAAGVIKGYADGTCRGDAFVNRAEALTILLRASKKDTAGAKANPFKDGQGWFTKDLNAAYEWGVVSGKTTTMFMPGDNVTRAEISKMAVKLNELMK